MHCAFQHNPMCIREWFVIAMQCIGSVFCKQTVRQCILLRYTLSFYFWKRTQYEECLLVNSLWSVLGPGPGPCPCPDPDSSTSPRPRLCLLPVLFFWSRPCSQFQTKLQVSSNSAFRTRLPCHAVSTQHLAYNTQLSTYECSDYTYWCYPGPRKVDNYSNWFNIWPIIQTVQVLMLKHWLVREAAI